MRTVTVTLDGREYQVNELRSRANRAWREQLESQFTGLAAALQNAPKTNLADGAALAGVVQSVAGTLLHSVEILTDLVHAYAPQLPLEDAFDSEVLDAFTAILGLAYPFGSVVERVMSGVSSLNQRTSRS
jgi:hypothetical protein